MTAIALIRKLVLRPRARGAITGYAIACTWPAIGDPETVSEPLGFIPSRPMLCPADILTSAASGSLAALDVGVCSPGAAGAGLDCCSAMVRRKQQAYEPFLGELRERGVRYQPWIWSCYGRAHVDALEALQGLARAAPGIHVALRYQVHCHMPELHTAPTKEKR